MNLCVLLLLWLSSLHTASCETHFRVWAVRDNVIITAPEGEYTAVGIRANGRLLPTFAFPSGRHWYVWTWARHGTFEAKIRVGNDYRVLRCKWSRITRRY